MAGVYVSQIPFADLSTDCGRFTWTWLAIHELPRPKCNAMRGLGVDMQLDFVLLSRTLVFTISLSFSS